MRGASNCRSPHRGLVRIGSSQGCCWEVRWEGPAALPTLDAKLPVLPEIGSWHFCTAYGSIGDLLPHLPGPFAPHFSVSVRGAGGPLPRRYAPQQGEDGGSCHGLGPLESALETFMRGTASAWSLSHCALKRCHFPAGSFPTEGLQSGGAAGLQCPLCP